MPSFIMVIVMSGGGGTGEILDVGTYQELVARGRYEALAVESVEDEEISFIRTVSQTNTQPENGGGDTNHEYLNTLSRTLSDFGASALKIEPAPGGSVGDMSEGVIDGLEVSGSSKKKDQQGDDLTKEEDRETGAVAASIWCLYMKLLGVRYMPLLAGLLMIYQVMNAGSTYWMAYWTQQVQTGSTDAKSFLYVYSGLLFGYCVIASFQSFLWVERSIEAGSEMHQNALWRLMRAPMHYFDTTIKGRIVNRFSNDLQKVDVQLQGNIKFFTVTLTRGLISLGILIVSAPDILLLLLPLSFIYLRTMNFYRASARELQRLTSKA
jgi:hypothetical protein